MRVLFLSQTSLFEPLGQSQVLAYVRGLAARGHTFRIVSFEPEPGRMLASEASLAHHPVRRRPGHGLKEKLADVTEAVRVCARLVRLAPPDVIHARSLLPAALGEAVRLLAPAAALVWDYPGFLPSEYLESGHWSAWDPRYVAASIAEEALLHRADAICVGTRHARDRVVQRVGAKGPYVQIVPSCVDTRAFRPRPEARKWLWDRLGWAADRDRFVVTYCGGLGSWYLDREMVRFFAALRDHLPEAHLLVLSRSEAKAVRSEARRLGVSDRLVVTRAPHAEMPYWLAGADLGLSLVAPLPSKRASSPVKLAEYLACGLPVVANAGVGAVEEHAAATPAIFLLEDLSRQELERVALRVAEAQSRYGDLRRAARAYALLAFDLDRVAVPAYEQAYREAVSRRSSYRSSARLRAVS